MRPLKEWLDAQNVPHEVDPTCQTPTRIERKSFSSLSLEEFACPPELLLAPRYIGATAGTAIWSDQLIAHGNFLRVVDKKNTSPITINFYLTKVQAHMIFY